MVRVATGLEATMRFSCPGCWRSYGEEFKVCANCGLDVVEFYKNKDYVEKLIIALRHPEPETPVRAAWILGEIGDARAIEPLAGLVIRTPDVYIASAAVKALARFDNPRVKEFLGDIVGKHQASMIRDAARHFPADR